MLGRVVRRASLARSSVTTRRCALTTEPKIVAGMSHADKVALTDELEERANRRWNELAAQHREIPADDMVRRKRLIYRSKQRGWLEGVASGARRR